MQVLRHLDVGQFGPLMIMMGPHSFLSFSSPKSK